MYYLVHKLNFSFVTVAFIEINNTTHPIKTTYYMYKNRRVIAIASLLQLDTKTPMVIV